MESLQQGLSGKLPQRHSFFYLQNFEKISKYNGLFYFPILPENRRIQINSWSIKKVRDESFARFTEAYSSLKPKFLFTLAVLHQKESIGHTQILKDVMEKHTIQKKIEISPEVVSSSFESSVKQIL